MIYRFREFFWNLPDNFVIFVASIQPFFSIVVASVFAILLIGNFENDFVRDLLKDSESKQITEGTYGFVEQLNPLLFNSQDYFINPALGDVAELGLEKLHNLDKQGNPTPAIGSEFSTTDGGKTFVIKINPDLNWSDGKQITAKDVVYTFNASKSINRADSVGSKFDNINITQSGEFEVRFELSNLIEGQESIGNFYELITFYVLPEHELKKYEQDFEGYDYLLSKVGAGNLRLDDIVGNSFEFVVNENWENSDFSIDNYSYKVFNDREKLDFAFSNGDIDVVSHSPSLISDLESQYSNFEIVKNDLPFEKKLLYFNTQNDTLANEDLRIALSYLFDDAKFYEENDFIDLESTNGPINDFSWAFSKDDDNKQFEFNKDLFDLYKKESGLEFSVDSPLSLELAYLKTDENILIADFLAQNWKDHGINLSVKEISYEVLTGELLQRRNFDMLLLETSFSVDPDQFSLWHTSQIDNQGLNFAGLSFENIDKTLEEGISLYTRTQRKDAYNKFQISFTNRPPVIFIGQRQFPLLVRDGINGFEDLEINYARERFENIEQVKF